MQCPIQFLIQFFERTHQKTIDPFYEDDVKVKNLYPVAFRFALGGHYFFTDNVGIGMELGIGGGAIINGGLAFKF
jgi:hypothetical protein